MPLLSSNSSESQQLDPPHTGSYGNLSATTTTIFLIYWAGPRTSFLTVSNYERRYSLCQTCSQSGRYRTRYEIFYVANATTTFALRVVWWILGWSLLLFSLSNYWDQRPNSSYQTCKSRAVDAFCVLTILKEYRTSSPLSPPAHTDFCGYYSILAADKIGDWTKLEIPVWNESIWSIVGARPRPIAAPCIMGRDNEAGKTSAWGPSPSHILQIHSLHQFATVTPSHVPLRRRGIIIAIFRGSGTNFMVPSDWDLSPICVCGPNFISYWIGESPILSADSILYIYSATRSVSSQSLKRCCSLFQSWDESGRYRPTREIFYVVHWTVTYVAVTWQCACSYSEIIGVLVDILFKIQKGTLLQG